MPELTREGLTLRWAKPASDAAQRVLIEAGPSSALNVVRLLVRSEGGPEQAIRAWPVGTNPENGLQTFAAVLPAAPQGRALAWRPVLQNGARSLDPGHSADAPDVHTLGETESDLSTKARAAAPSGAPSSSSRLATGMVDTPTPAVAARLEDSNAPLFDIRWEYTYRIYAPFEHDPHSIGVTPDGIRVMFQIRPGGLVRGPLMNGTIEALGGDWMRIRPDGIGIADVHAIIRPDNGGELLTEYSGIADFGPHSFAAIAGGHFPETVPVRLTPRYLTSDPKWAWLNREQCFSVGEVDLKNGMLQYDEYRAVSTRRGATNG